MLISTLETRQVALSLAFIQTGFLTRGSAFPFMRLLGELRNRIYLLACSSAIRLMLEFYKAMRLSKSRRSTTLSLIVCSKLVAREVIPLVLGKKWTRLELLQSLKAFTLKALHVAPYVRRLYLELDGLDYALIFYIRYLTAVTRTWTGY